MGKQKHGRTQQRLDVQLEALRVSEIWVNSALVQNYLRDALLDQLVVLRPHIDVIADREQVLQDGEEERFGCRL